MLALSIPFFEIVGMIGVLQILMAFLLLQLDKLTTRTLNYQLLNAFGAAFILYSLCFRFNLSALTIEACWLLISIYGIVRIVSDSGKSPLEERNGKE
jgi:predicted membrane protein